MAKFGSSGKPANQGGIGPAHSAPSRTSSAPKGGQSTPSGGGSTNDYGRRVKPIGGSGTTASKPKPFK